MKSPFTNCEECPLKEQDLIVGETNCPDNLEDVDLLIFAEAPALDEVRKGRPLIGQAGKTFRKAFKESKLDTLNYYVSNVVLCSNLQLINGKWKTFNPPDEAQVCCENNWKTLIDTIKPKCILIMGGIPMKTFGISDTNAGITKKRGKFYEYNDIPVFLAVHPSYVNNSGGVKSEVGLTYIEDFNSVYEFLSEHNMEDNNEEIISTLTEPHSFTYPQWMMSNDVCLMDIQRFRNVGEVCFIFRTKSGEKKYHSVPDKEYYFYSNNTSFGDSPMLLDVSKIKLNVEDSPKVRKVGHYESDVRTEVKHAVDYYYQRKRSGVPELDVKLKIMYFDIEIYNERSKSFPDPKTAPRPINSISFQINDGPTEIYIAKLPEMEKKENIKIPDGFIVTFFDNERDLLVAFCKKIKKVDPDQLSGWNCISGDEYIWMDNKIKRFSDCIEMEETSSNGKILKKVYTGLKDQYQLNTDCGTSIKCSEKHIFPIMTKEKHQYKNINTLRKSKQDLSVMEIEDLLDSNQYDVYLNMKRKNNENDPYTYRDYILENLELFLSFDAFDIMFQDISLRNKLKYIPEARMKVKHADSWTGKNFYKHGIKWTYKTFNKWISFNDIKNELINNKYQNFKILNRRVEIDLDQPISYDDLRLLGFEYTDGFWSKYDNQHYITNKELDVIEHYGTIMNGYRRSKRTDWSSFFSHKVYNYDMGYVNSYTLLMPLIYKSNRSKGLNLNLSRLSYDQFMSFFSGAIDGDGSVVNGTVSLCNFENNGIDIDIFNQLLLWNDAVCYSNVNYVYVPNKDYNTKFYETIDIKHPKRKNNLKDQVKCKNSASDKIRLFVDGDDIIVKLKNITKMEKAEMYDIETEIHYFICNGILTHNSNSFDIPTILNRLKKHQIQLSLISPIGRTYFNSEKYNNFYIGGIHCLDQLELYKELTYSIEESYKLSAIAQKLIGKDKVAYEGTLDDVYENDIENFINYSGTDTGLLYEINKKTGHIELKNELRRICSSTWKISETTTGLIDPMVISYAKHAGLVCKDGAGIKTDDKIPGAYVRHPKAGLHSWLVDFDYTALYPSIICSMNIGPNTILARIPDEIAIAHIYSQEDRLPKEFDIRYDPIYTSGKKSVIQYSEFKKWVEDEQLIVTASGRIFCSHKTEVSFFYKILRYILDSRAEYRKKKTEAKNNKLENETQYYENVQLAYKILANSLYGVLANTGFRFFSHDLAMTVTLTGQEAIKFIGYHAGTYMKEGTKEINGEFLDNYEERKIPYLIYTDTDSIFLNMGDYLVDKDILKI